jgi:hypothetical protein
MDRGEARTVLAAHLGSFRRRSYADLVALIGDVRVAEISGPSGATYQIEVEVRWDSPSDQTNIRVLGGIDDGRFLSALTPLNDSFIVSPGGRFVGE